MTGFEKYIYEHLHVLRRLVQVTALLFLFAVPILNKFGFNEILGTFYSIKIGNLDIVDPALMLQNILLTKEIYFPMLLAGIIPLIITLLLGKVFCSWVCPFNLFAEFTDMLRRKIRPKTVTVRHHNPKPHHYWLVFGVILTAVAVLGVPLIALTSMPGLISGQIADALFWGSLGFESLFVLFILAVEVFRAPRFWCKYACPVGATLSLLRSRHTLKIHYNPQQCSCKPNYLPCNSACPVQLDPRHTGIYPYCFNCGECVDACRNEGQALTFTLQPAEKFSAVQIQSRKPMID